VISPDKDAIARIIASIQADYVLTDDGDLRDYLGVRIIRDGSKVTMFQPKMTQRCLEILHMPMPDKVENRIKIHDTPANPKMTLHADRSGPERKCDWAQQLGSSTICKR